MSNINDVPVAFDLTCCSAANAGKTLYVTIAAHGTTEIGWMEGWPGNFVPGESCEANHQNQILWRVRIT